MIRVKKPEQIPAILENEGTAKRAEMCDAFDNGETAFEFDNKIYGHETVKSVLKKAQHDKCFLCESKVTHISSGDVEHFRPKGGYRQSAKHKLKKPGYFWLAYDWKNLFFVCELCNRRFKKNLFPLLKLKNRCTSHKNNTNLEEPLFINPETENPEDFISFRGEIVFAIDGNLRGKTTIEGAGLNRIELEGNRKTVLEKIRLIYNLANNNPSSPYRDAAIICLQEYTSETHEYSSMIKAALAAEFKF
jgi:uncharacterized protein (TIGR02646 family)